MKTLFIGKTWPEPHSSAAGRRTLDLFDFIQEQGWPLHFATAAKPTEYCLNEDSLSKRQIDCNQIKVNDDGFDHWLTELQPELVIFDRFMTEEQFGWRVATHCPQSIRILDTSDLHCLRHQRQQAEKGNTIALQNDIALREIASMYRSDLTLMISEFEMQLLKHDFALHQSLLHYLPFVFAAPERTVNRYEQRQHFMFIGGFIHEPNVDAVMFAKQQVWPLIRKALPNAELHIYGGYAPEKINQLHNAKQGFIVKGRAEDALQTMQQYRINLSPLRFGAGLKGKVFEAFSTGLVNVTTRIGLEGLPNCEQLNADYDAAEHIALRAIELYQAAEQWQQAQQQGFEMLQHFAKETHFANLLNRITDLQHNLATHRQHNFIGAMLNHHHHRSTEFMSRWISSKNALTELQQNKTTANEADK